MSKKNTDVNAEVDNVEEIATDTDNLEATIDDENLEATSDAGNVADGGGFDEIGNEEICKIPGYTIDTLVRQNPLDVAKLDNLKKEIEGLGKAIRFEAKVLADYLGVTLGKSLHGMVWNINKRPEVTARGLKFGLRDSGKFLSVTIKELSN